MKTVWFRAIILVSCISTVYSATASLVLNLANNVAAGNTVTYNCSSEGSGPDPRITWSIETNDRTVVRTNSQLSSSVVGGNENTADGTVKSSVTFVVESSYLTNHRLWCGAIDGTDTSPSIQIYTTIAATTTTTTANLGGSCSTTVTCSTAFSSCSSSICRCNTGYYDTNGNSNPGGSCYPQAGLGGTCQAGNDLSCSTSNSQCSSSSPYVCECITGYIQSGNTCVLGSAGLGESCASPSRTCYVSNSYCNGICVCSPGYYRSGTVCLISPAGIGQSCINPSRACPTNAGCTSGICQCNSGYTYSSSLGYCVPSSASISQSCINPTRTCPTNAGCVSGICQCNSGYTFSSSLGYCVTSSAGISQSCINPTRTCPTNAGCVNGICQCNSDYTYSSSLGYCVRSSAGISESCINPTRICPTNAGCVSGICLCNSGYTYSSSLGNCVTNIANVGESCVNPTRTCVSDALCTGSVCQCVSGYYAQSGICYQKAAVGQSCSTAVSDSCTDTHASCTGSPPTCRCNSGYSFSNSVCAVTSTSNCPAGSSSASTVTGTTNPSTPSVTVGQTCYEVDLYDTQVLECRDSKGSGALQSVRWLKAPSFSQVTTSTGSFINGDIAIPNLTVSNAQSSYAGDYVCQLCYGASYTQCTNGSTVTVLVRGTALTSVTATVNSTTPVRGSQVTFTCTAMPNGAATSYIWYFSSTQVSTTAVYTISSVGISQDGTYRCQAGNSYGTVTSNTVEVDVQYIPEPSGGTTVLTTGDLGIADIVITCNMNANPPVLFYAFYNDGDSLLQNSSSNTYIVTSSTGYQVYRCRGLNSVGLSSRQYHDVQQESTHISECTETPSLCSQGCTELQGGYECYCNETGYRLDTDQSTCVVCSDNTYGNNCTQTCTCDVANTLSCIHTNGTCRCKDGFDGSTCADDVNECADSNIHQCPANSVCINNNGSFYCKCDNGYLKAGDGTCQVCTQGTHGENCNDTCECVTRSTVSCNHVSGTCSCKEGWEANDCSQDIDECTADTARCPVNSNCRNTDGSYVCDCVVGYKTVNGTCQVCDEIFFGESCATPCACFAVNTEVCDHVSGACTCKAGWEGSDCSQNINECSGDNPDCPENSQCQDTQGSYICACNTGYGKTSNGTCEDVDECSDESNNCDSNATCTNTAGNFTCACDDGFTGDGTTCSDVDECSDDRNNCDSNATCTNTVGSFTCICYLGYSGEGTNCSDTDECSDGSSNCDRNAECINSVGSFICACKSGYSGNGTSCTGVDECTDGSYSCDTNAECTNTNGSFNCDCNMGYSGNGTDCTDIDECTDGSNSCDTNAECTNSIGSFTCTCNTGYSGNGTSCTDIDECSDGNNNCDTNAECTNTVGSFMCACNTGYSGNGTSCADIDECTDGSNNCTINAKCTNYVGSFTCACNTGYSGNGTLCTDIDECSDGNNNCDTNAECTNTVGSFTCACNTGYNGNGTSCTDSDECSDGSNNCDRNAECTNSVGSFTCACNTGYSGNGTSCTEIDECSDGSDNCDTNAECTNTAGSFTCVCNPGYSGYGTDCTDIDECSDGSDNCDSNAACSNTPGSFTCVCNTGYRGDGISCTDINECSDGSNNCDDNAACTNTEGSFTCSCNDRYTGDGVKCSDSGLHFLEYGTFAGDRSVMGTDDACLARIDVSYQIPFMNRAFRFFYICPNGIISFGRRYTSYTVPVNQEFRNDLNNIYALAPYFADMILTSTGTIWYQAYDRTSGKSEEKDVVFNFVQSLVRKIYEIQITPIYVFKATWDRVPRFGGPIIETVTFQVLYVTDGEVAYTFYIYGDMQFGNSVQFIGLLTNGFADGLSDSPDGTYLARPNLNLELGPYLGAASFDLISNAERTPNYGAQCLVWAQQQTIYGSLYRSRLNWMPECPCWSFFFFFDRRFGHWRYDFGTNTFQISALPRHFFAPYGKTCVYNIFGSFIGFGNQAGSFQTYNDIWYPRENANNDLYYRRLCCELSNNCEAYYHVRPRVSRCYSILPFRFGGGFGDPHITTLDGKTYTFNGHGEYVLLRVTNADFEIQSRTDRPLTKTGAVSEATIFSAFAVQSSDAWLQVELNSEKTGINIFVGTNKSTWDDFTADFVNDGDNFTFVSESLSLSRDNNTLVSSFSETGIAFNVTVNVGLLQMALGLNSEYEGNTTGLLGNFNEDPEDDYVPRDSTSAIPITANESVVYTNFGQTWMTRADESIFKYDNGKSHADYIFPDYVPTFLDEIKNETLLNEAKDLCGENNDPCVLDYVVTGIKELAEVTTTTEQQAEANTDQALNIIPSLNVRSGTTVVDERDFLYVNMGEAKTFTLLGTDDGTLTYALTNASDSVTLGTPRSDGTVDVTVNVTDTNPIYVSITATDDKGAKSPAADVVIVLCTQCNSHGTCNNSDIREDSRSTDTFKFATCICNSFWEGLDCEEDLDGCDDNPCSVGRNCTDRPANEHEADPDLKPYTCTPCPIGYEDIDDKCDDINECNGTSGCSQTCVNTPGSFHCQCNTGYRPAADGFTCNDINECDEATSGCTQVCNNTAGSFICSCFNGYTYNATSNVCVQDETVPSGCSDIDCSSASGCSINETGSAVCFCNGGYEIQADNTCTDIDECDTGVCSQSCDNTDGSYACSCFAGYKLQDDRVSCEPCQFPGYGENCDQTCHCGRGALRCDPVRGCVCKPGWTGTGCTIDINECQDSNVCGDINKVCTNTVGSYTCPCRSGYILSEGRCVDVNECENAGLNTCEQACSNTEGGFACSCNTGYNINATDATRCVDYDECAAGVSGCEHICTNTQGRFHCECYFGFLLNSDRKTCTKVSDPCALFPDVNCSDICLVINEAPQCSCNTGFVLGADQQNCIDVNECDTDLNLCSEAETCVNTDGGYTCSCSIGFKLANDLRTCQACDTYHFGENCANECNCGVGASRCDSVTGCVCETGWTGEKCDIDRNECDGFSCTGQSEICTNTPGSYTCACETGYSRDLNDSCQDIDECSNATLNFCSQICTNIVGGYKCSCNPGFIQDGNSCADINECEGQNDCSQVCTNTLGSYRCSCNDGFQLDVTTRKTCIPEAECNPNPCLDNTQCTVINNNATCICDAGYEALNKTACADIPECTETPSLCSQGCTELQGGYACYCNETGYRLDADQSTCVVCSDNTYGDNCTQNCTCEVANTLSCIHTNGTCSCKDGWKGNTCTDDVDECSNANIHQCPANSKCINTNGSFYCKCENGYLKAGDGTCQVCTQGKYGENCNNTCECVTSNTASCKHANGTCACKEGWEADDCSQDIDECIANTATCPENSSCRNTVGSYVCECDAGYKTVNGTCQDVDECRDGSNNCYSNATCANTIGNFTCACNYGFTGNGTTCSDVDECSDGSNNCDSNATCKNNVGSFTCACNNGFTGNGTTCSDVDECSDGSNNCDSNATCTNTVGDFKCSCIDGLTGDGTSCSDVDECSNDGNNCDSNATCTNTDGSFTCTCNPGYSGDGTNCSVCVGTWGDQCSNECTCDAEKSVCDRETGVCTCSQGWQGENCTEDVNECETDPTTCVPNSKCTNTVGSRTCTCNTGYKTRIEACFECTDNTYGDECGTPCDCVANNTMTPSQSCNNVNGTCGCTPFWTGSRCELDIDECETGTHNCTNDNNGCHNTDNGFTCSCLLGYIKDSNSGCIPEEITTAPTTSQRLPTQTAIRVLLTLNITVRGNLSVSQTNSEYAQEVQKQLTFIYRERLLNEQFAITILRVWEGSLHVDYLIEILTSLASFVAAVTGDIGGGHIPVPVFGKNGSVLLMVIGNITITPGALSRDALLCEVYQASVGSCEADFVCDVVDGTPLCQQRDKEDNLPLILGLGIGLPMFFLCVAAVVLFIVYFHNRRKLHGRRVYWDGDRSSSSSGGSKIPVRLNTRFPKGLPYCAPDLPTNPDYSEYAREPRQYSHSAEPESDNRFTLDLMPGIIRPDEKYHIKRPKIVKDNY